MSKKEIRAMIDEIDSQILELLSQRAGYAKKTAKFKKYYYDPVREREVFDRLLEENPGPLKSEHVEAIYREIMSACRGLQSPISVAFLGPRATFSHQAVISRFGNSIIEEPCPDIASVFDAVEKDVTNYGVVPFENSTEGVINYTLDRFSMTSIRICGEIYADIALNLISKQKDIKDIKKIFTHPKAMEQCAGWLQRNASGKEIIQMESTGLAAQRAAKSRNGGAIASLIAAEIYGLNVLEQRVEDYKDNKTRFLVIGKQKMPNTGRDKTSVLFSVRHEPGTLYRALKSFEEFGLNLTMMQARPSRKSPWEYVFFVDLKGHETDEEVKKAIQKMKKETLVLKVIGSYPMSER